MYEFAFRAFCDAALVAGVKSRWAAASTEVNLVYTGLETRPRVRMMTAPATTKPTPTKNWNRFLS